MVKLAVLLLLAGLSGNAAADWIRVGENDSVNAYADPASIRVDRHFVKMSDLMDLQTLIASERSALPVAGGRHRIRLRATALPHAGFFHLFGEHGRRQGALHRGPPGSVDPGPAGQHRGIPVQIGLQQYLKPSRGLPGQGGFAPQGGMAAQGALRRASTEAMPRLAYPRSGTSRHLSTS